MNSDTLLDSLRSLELRWRDLAAALLHLAESLPPQAPQELLIDLVGLDNTPATIPSLRSRALQQADAVHAALTALQGSPNLTTAQLLGPAAGGSPAGVADVFGQANVGVITDPLA